MTRNPHEIVTLDDQPEDTPSYHPEHRHCSACEDAAQPDNEGPSRYLLACGCALDGPEYHCGACGQQHPNHASDCSYITHDDDDYLGATAKEVERLNRITASKPMRAPKSMRIRYMELPGEINPNTHELTTPFVIVIDRAGNDYDGDFADIAIQTGARGTLLFRGEVQIGDDPE